jgi:ribosomal protein S14
MGSSKGNEKKERSKKIKEFTCKFCGAHKGMIRKYNLLICRRCFKDNAESLGFRKYN